MESQFIPADALTRIEAAKIEGPTSIGDVNEQVFSARPGRTWVITSLKIAPHLNATRMISVYLSDGRRITEQPISDERLSNLFHGYLDLSVPLVVAPGQAVIIRQEFVASLTATEYRGIGIIGYETSAPVPANQQPYIYEVKHTPTAGDEKSPRVQIQAASNVEITFSEVKAIIASTGRTNQDESYSVLVYNASRGRAVIDDIPVGHLTAAYDAGLRLLHPITIPPLNIIEVQLTTFTDWVATTTEIYAVFNGSRAWK